jgi:hypothetical protein
MIDKKTIDTIVEAEGIIKSIQSSKGDLWMTEEQLEIVAKALYMARCEIAELKFQINIQMD